MKNLLYNPKGYKKLRQYLRKNLTRAEVLLWSRLQKHQVYDYKFRRQFGVGNYVLDFYCPELKLAIEIDGDTHFRPQAIVNDTSRQKFLESLGIKTLRFTNNDIYQNISGVMETIIKSVTLIQ